MGCCVRDKFPGLVTLPDGRVTVAWTWKHYSYPPVVLVVGEEDEYFKVDNAQQRVLFQFWVSFYDFTSFNNSKAYPNCK
jgi:hypothetical protein